MANGVARNRQGTRLRDAIVLRSDNIVFVRFSRRRAQSANESACGSCELRGDLFGRKSVGPVDEVGQVCAEGPEQLK